MMRTRSLLALIAVFMHTFPSMLLIYALTTTASKQSLPRCHEEERSALLEFKQSFHMYQDEPRFVSWNLAEGGEGGNCCSWHGVQCDNHNGHVIGLNLSDPTRVLSASSINSSSSLFRLTYIEKLDLSHTNFNDSLIPSAIGNLLRLKVLDLSLCQFTGQVPQDILGLTNLSSLDLSDNNGLKLGKMNMEDIARCLTKLEELNLGSINISALLPIALANLTSLKSLVVSGCGLHGKFPTSILNLPNLQVLDVSYNYDLSGELALPRSTCVETHCASLRVFDISGCNFSGPIDPTASLGNCTKLTTLRLRGNWFHGKPPSFVNLNKLTELDLSYNALTGEIPSSFGNLTLLSYLYLSFNQFTGELPSSIGYLHQLSSLSLFHNSLTGSIPPSFGNLTLLSSLDLCFNRLSGQIPFSIGNLHQLSSLYLANNSLTGSIPPSIGSLTRLQELILSNNRLTGPIPSPLGNLTLLYELDISSNQLTNPIPSSIGNLTWLSLLYLSSNQLNGTIPSSIGKLSYLSELDINSNWLGGQIPSSLGKLGSVTNINLCRNKLTSHTDDFLVNLKYLTGIDLSFNNLHGPLPTPPTSIEYYVISNNKLSGELPTLICSLSQIRMLDLANNNFGGMVPQCLTNSSNYLQVLSLHENNFSGAIPQQYPNLCVLRMMDISRNRFQGPLPRSLANCTGLEFLNFGNNLIKGTFPSWMGSLSELRILMLHSNTFHGEIPQPKSEFEFASLHIMDASNNNFSGAVPFNCFRCWNGMRVRNSDGTMKYISDLFPSYGPTFKRHHSREYYGSMKIISKGSRVVYTRILNGFTVIDFSSNNFSGEIPEGFGGLQGLHLLNLSNNLLKGQIPPILSNLTGIEALDISSNMLSGEIPEQLTSLGFLAVFNVSCNRLSGAIPRGKQFNTFDNSSYSGNVGLCGDPLSKKCGERQKETPSPTKDNSEDSNGLFELDWKIILMGFASGTMVGVFLGQGITIGRDNCFVRKLKPRISRRHR